VPPPSNDDALGRLRCPRAFVFAVALLVADIALQVLGCNRRQVQEAAQGTAEATSALAPRVLLSARLARPTSDRIVAIRDLHGDRDHARRALRLAGAPMRTAGGSAGGSSSSKRETNWIAATTIAQSSISSKI